MTKMTAADNLIKTSKIPLDVNQPKRKRPCKKALFIMEKIAIKIVIKIIISDKNEERCKKEIMIGDIIIKINKNRREKGKSFLIILLNKTLIAANSFFPLKNETNLTIIRPIELEGIINKENREIKETNKP